MRNPASILSVMGLPPHRISGIVDRWIAAGRPYCDHPHRDTVQDMGVPPEEYVCLVCGWTWDMGDEPEPHGNRTE
jgi:hypothetical protein